MEYLSTLIADKGEKKKKYILEASSYSEGKGKGNIHHRTGHECPEGE